MSSLPPSVGRPADRKNLIVAHLRRRIAGGELTPGSQLPTRNEIGQYFSASPVTVQSALEHLRRDGFITVNGRQGTYVAERPPHLTNYALVFPSRPKCPLGWVRFWTALGNEAISLRTRDGGRIQMYYDVNSHLDSDDCRRLLAEVSGHRLAGMIFVTPHPEFLHLPLMEEQGIPRVVISGPTADTPVPKVGPDQFSFWTRAAHYMAERGRRRVAVLHQQHQPAFMDRVLDILKDAGLVVCPHWVQGVHLSAPEMARNLTHLLLHSGQAERPDGLIIADDNLVEPAGGGVIASGMSVPGDLEIIGHCNYPWPAPSALAVQRLGYDSRRILQGCLQVLADVRDGHEVPPFQPIEAQFEDEVTHNEEFLIRHAAAAPGS